MSGKDRNINSDILRKIQGVVLQPCVKEAATAS